MGKNPGAPPAPDYGSNAYQTAASNADAARIATKANRINQYTPYGNVTYANGVNGDQDQWRSDISLSPSGQQLLDIQNNISLGLGNQGVQGLNRVDQSLSKPFDYGSVNDVQNAALKSYTSRLDPIWQKNEQQMDSQLANKGIPVGSEAWQAEKDNFARSKNDAYQQAVTGAISTSPQTFQLASALREQPLNEVNALRTGSQVTNPQFQQAGMQQTTAGANVLGAGALQGQYDMNSYNQRVAMANQDMSGLFSLGQQAMANSKP